MTRVADRHFALIAVAVLAFACAGRPGDSPSGFDIASEFAKVTSAQTALSTARERLDSARTGTPGLALGQGLAETRLKEAQADFDAAYARNQRVLARFLNVALNQAPGRPETKEALDFYARDAVSNGVYTLAHGGDRAAALKALADVERAYRALGLGVPREAASAIEDLRRSPTPTPLAGANPPLATAASPAGSRRQKGRHPASLDSSKTLR